MDIIPILFLSRIWNEEGFLSLNSVTDGKGKLPDVLSHLNAPSTRMTV